MAIRIQIRRDTAANFSSNNPVLYPGEVGFETDTKKLKIGPAVVSPAVATAWNSISGYANVVPSDLSNTLNDYILAADLGEADGPAKLNVDGNLLIPEDSIIFEGATANNYETTLQVTDPTADRTITLPDSTGTLVLKDTTDTLTNKSISLTTNTVTGTIAEFNSAVTNADFATIAGTETLTNKTLTTPIISSISNSGTITVPTGNLTLATISGTETLTNKTLTSPIVSGLYISDGSIVVEGATADNYETTLVFTDPTADRTITFPNASFTVASTADISAATGGSVSESGTQTLTNKTIDLASNTLTGTRAQFNTAMSDDNFATIAGTETLTNKTLTTPTISSITNGAATLTLPTSTGTIALAADVAALSGATFTGAVSGTSLTLSGDLTINGTTTNINSTNLVVEDKNIVIGDTATPSDASADGGGITLKGTTDKTFNWVDATDSWTSSENINLASGKSLKLNGTDLKDVTETLTNKTITSPLGITKTDVGLGNVDNTSDANKPISTATQTGLNLKAPLASPTFTGTVAGVTSAHVGLGNVDNTSDASKPISTATQTALNDKVSLSDPAVDYYITNSGSGAYLVNGVSNGTIHFEKGKKYRVVVNASGHPFWIQTVSGAYSSGNIYSTGITNNGAQNGSIIVELAQNAPSSLYYACQYHSSMAGSISTENISPTIQTALDGKVDESLFDAKGDILVASADNVPAKLTVGTNGYLLTANSAATNGIEWAAAPVSLPSQTGNSGKYLTTDGSTASWGTLVVPIETGTATLTANTATTVSTTALSSFTSIEYMVSLKQGSKIRTSKVIFQTDGTSVDITEFGITETGGTLAGVVVSGTTASTNAVLQVTVTDASSSNVTVKFSKVSL